MNATLLKFCADAINFVYPPRCVLCRQDLPSLLPSPLCVACDPREHLFTSEVLSGETKRPGCSPCRLPICLRCGDHQEDPSESCIPCLGLGTTIREMRSLWLYTPSVEHVIKALKYRLERQLIRFFAAEFLMFLLQQDPNNSFSAKRWSVVIPVPSNRTMLAHRGFSHMALLVRELCLGLDLPADILSLRSRAGLEPQAGLSRTERVRLSKIRYYLKPQSSFKGKSILLVDDILTTGLSALNCARVLMESGARAVDVLTIARSSLFRQGRG